MTFHRAITLAGLALSICLTASAQLSGITTQKTSHASRLSFDDMNQLFGISLWSTNRLWDEEDHSVATRLQARTEFNGSNIASFVCRPSSKIFGLKAENLRLSSREHKPDSLLIMFTNKGDSITAKPRRDAFKKPADYDQALSAYQKNLTALPNRIRTEFALIEPQLTKALGAPERLTFGEGASTTELVKLWWWNEHAILLATSPGESLSIRIVPPNQAKAKGRSGQVSQADLKKELKNHIERRPNGDVVVTGIPMVSQGGKGYCVPATWSRYLQYLAIPVDEYVLANAADTGPGGGTYLRSMTAAVRPIAAQHKRRLVSFTGTPNISVIAQYINEGLPLMWNMCSVGPFAGTGRRADRMGMLTPETWAKTLRAAKPDPKLTRNTGFHMCMIIGYNKATKEIATSDSWGPQHAEKWYTLDEAQRVSRDEYYIITW